MCTERKDVVKIKRHLSRKHPISQKICQLWAIFRPQYFWNASFNVVIDREHEKTDENDKQVF